MSKSLLENAREKSDSYNWDERVENFKNYIEDNIMDSAKQGLTYYKYKKELHKL